MSDWLVLKKEKTCQTYLLLFNEECIEPLSWANFELRLGICQANVKRISVGYTNGKLDVGEIGHLLDNRFRAEIMGNSQLTWMSGSD